MRIDKQYAIDNIGEAEWFWVEVPVASLNLKGDNYLALWSPTPELVAVASSPVVAAGVGGKDSGTWIIQNLKGQLPETPAATPGLAISYFDPALAMKLIPASKETRPLPRVGLVSWQPGTADHPRPVVTANVAGESIERVWLEYRSGNKRRGDVAQPNWVKVGRPVWKAPYVTTVPQEELPTGHIDLRVSAADAWENIGMSDFFSIEVAAVPEVVRPPP